MSDHRDSSTTAWIDDRLDEVADARSRGEADAVGSLIEGHPEWGDERAIRLIYEDFCERRERGEEATTRDELRRYPKFREELALLLDFDHLVRANSRRVDFPRAGEGLGTFSLLSEIGRGASGRAYLATEGGLADRLVVLKVQPIDQDEHLTLAQLQNTHVIPLFSEQAFPERGLRALCMPYLGGTCLDRLLLDLADSPPQSRTGGSLLDAIERLQPRRLDHLDFGSPCRLFLQAEGWTNAVCWIAACLADALASAHSRGLIHMDLKPSNVLIAGDGLPLLLDFHLARRPLRAGEVDVGRLGGTPGWMAPEHASAFEAAGCGRPIPGAVDGRSDIYALGLLLATALDGRSQPTNSLASGIVWTPANSGLPPGLIGIVRRCLAVDPSQRFASATSLADELRRHLNDLPLKEIQNRNVRERWAKWRRRRPGALVRLVVGSIGIGTVLATLATLSGDHLRRLADADEAVAIGRSLIASKRYAEAIPNLSRALSRLGRRPDGGRAESLRGQLISARLGKQSDELHRLADSLRFRFGVHPPDKSAARTLERNLMPIWDERDPLLGWASNSNDAALRERVCADLLEVATIAADSRLRCASESERPAAESAAIALLREAGRTCGPSQGLRRRMRAIRPDPARPDDTSPADDRDRYELGRFHLQAGEFAEALESFDRISRDHPQDFWASFYLGVSAFRLGRYDESASAFRVCEALSPTSGECIYNHARALESSGQIDRAQSGYTRAIGIAPHLAEAWLNRGILNSSRGNDIEAISDLNQALRRAEDPEIRIKAADSLRVLARKKTQAHASSRPSESVEP